MYETQHEMMGPPKLRLHHVASRDGTRIAVHDGEVPAGAGALLLVGPPSATVVAWQSQISYLGSRFAIRAFHTRGLYGSDSPATSAFSMPELAADLDAALDDQGAEPAMIVAWSAGAVLALDLLRRRPARVAKLVLLDPILGFPLARALGVAESGALAPVLDGLKTRGYPAFSRLRQRVGLWPETSAWLKRLGLASPTLDDEVFADMAGAFRKLDMEAYGKTMATLLGHDLAPELARIRQPILVVAGDADRFSPILTARRLVRQIPFGELFVVKGGTHYTPMEYPELVNLRIEKFLDS